jgi:hypothetical protein
VDTSKNIHTSISISSIQNAPGVEDSVEPFYDHHIMHGDRSQKMASQIAMQMQRRGNSARYRYALNIEYVQRIGWRVGRR